VTVRAQRPEGAAWERVCAALREQRARAAPVCAYVYDLATLVEQVRAVRRALPDPCQLYYAVKANTHPSVLRTLVGRVDGFEVSSLGEIHKVRAVSAAPLALSAHG
jgi:diaminopimelate decarboxylase